MKANELMIGDWVNFGSFVRQVIQSDYYQDVNGDCVLDGVKPVPLTAELLKKNGFVVEPEYCFGEPLQYCEIVDGSWIYISGENYVEGKLEYVHELQHALKLCGIEKEIVL